MHQIQIGIAPTAFLTWRLEGPHVFRLFHQFFDAPVEERGRGDLQSLFYGKMLFWSHGLLSASSCLILCTLLPNNKE